MTIAQPSGEHKCPTWSDCGPSLRLSNKTLLAPCGSSLSPQTSSASHHLPMLPEKCQTASDHSQLASTSGCGAVSSLSSDADRLCLCKTRCVTKRCSCKNKDRVCSKYCHPQRSCCNKIFTKKCEYINISDDCDTKQKAILWTIIDDIHLYDSDTMILESKGGNHWIMVSSSGCSWNTVKIYDSLNLRLSPTIVKVIAEFLHTSNDFFTIEHARMQCQTGSDDCGLFAIASACALCYEHDP